MFSLLRTSQNNFNDSCISNIREVLKFYNPGDQSCETDLGSKNRVDFELNLFTPICFVLFMIMDLPYICDHQVGYSAGGYSLSPRWFLTWYIYPFFSGLAALMGADIARNL